MSAAVAAAVLAVLVFVLTQSFLALVLEPIREQRRLIGEVAHALLFYANVMPAEAVRVNDKLGERTVTVGSAPEEVDATRKALRELAGRLRASLWSIPFYDALALIRVVPRLADVLEASAALVGWSNSVGQRRERDTEKRRKVIADRLGSLRVLAAPSPRRRSHKAGVASQS